MVQVIAHRGARSLAPENTLIAAVIGFKAGAGLWETDVRMTKDGHLILFHDNDLLRCTNAAAVKPESASFLVSDWTWDEIRRLDAGSWFFKKDPFGQIAAGRVSRTREKEYRHIRVPDLDEGLRLTQESAWKINLELKYAPGSENKNMLPQKVLAAVRCCGIGLDRVVISSFNHEWLKWVETNEPRMEVQALIGETGGESGETQADFKDFSFPVYNVAADLLTRDHIRRLKAQGKRINVFTVNEPGEFKKFNRWGVDGIFTDFPQRFSGKTI